MTLAEARYHFDRIQRKLRARQMLEVSLLSLAVGAMTAAVLSPLDNSIIPWSGAITTTTIGWFYLARKKRLRRDNSTTLNSLINYQFPELEDSTDLITRDPATLNSLQQIQQERSVREFEKAFEQITLPGSWKRAGLVFLASMVVFIASTLVPINQGKRTTQGTREGESKPEKIVAVKLPASVSNVHIEVSPPSYTALPKTTVSNPNLRINEGSLVRWTISFSKPIQNGLLLFAGKENLALKKISSDKFQADADLKSSTFYQIQWKDDAGTTKSSDFYRIEVVPDNAPNVSIPDLQQSIDLTIKDKLTIDVKAHVQDDYGLRDSYIIATVSKGSGESVKFREEKLYFATPKIITGKNLNAQRTLDLLKLGLEPGDELYFYAEAIDNKVPNPNRTRTETFFITLQDTASQSLSIEGGLGVDLMPDYFRSQRQIIIDTEKLLKSRKQISKPEFNATSNELGYDQKVLRLKYGEFLGEEFETRLGEVPGPEKSEENAEDIAKKYTHDHDTENEHNQVAEKQSGDAHDHPTGQEDGKEESIIDAYKHQHDNAEEATFFNQSIRSKLKAALTQMWDAELYLRLYEPEKSLPFQYKALKLLKEVSNDARIYVHKTGFDPPPLKEEKRLTGDLSEIKNNQAAENFLNVETLPSIRQALGIIERKLASNTVTISSGEKLVLRSAGRELAILAIEKPGYYLNTLSNIKSLIEDDLQSQDVRASLLDLRKSFWKALPDQTTSPESRTQALHSLNKSFIKNIESLKNE